MRPPSFDSQALRRYLLAHKIADLPKMREALGGASSLTVSRMLKVLQYVSSYTHRGKFYSLREIVCFDDQGLWAYDDVWFSRFGTLVETLASWVVKSPQGYFADELADQLHVEVQDPLHDLVRQGRLRRNLVNGRFLYTTADSRSSKDQIRVRSATIAVPIAVDASAVQVSPEELKAAILLFYSLLDEQQRRLYAGLESIRIGHGGDTLLAEFLRLDAHTVARGRQQLLDHDVATGRTRRHGGGRPSIEKKDPTSSH
jgi:hypothetical protein